MQQIIKKWKTIFSMNRIQVIVHCPAVPPPGTSPNHHRRVRRRASSYSDSHVSIAQIFESPKKMEQRAWQDVAKDFGIKTDLSSLLSEIDSVIFDCDGVVWRGDAAIDKSKDFINALYKLGKKVLFVSNNATKTLAQYSEKFTKMSIPVEEYQVNHSALATARYMKNNLENEGSTLWVHQVWYNFGTQALKSSMGRRTWKPRPKGHENF